MLADRPQHSTWEWEGRLGLQGRAGDGTQVGGTNTAFMPAHGAGRQVPLLREWVWLQERSEEVLSETVVSCPICIRSAWARLSVWAVLFVARELAVSRHISAGLVTARVLECTLMVLPSVGRGLACPSVLPQGLLLCGQKPPRRKVPLPLKSHGLSRFPLKCLPLLFHV